MYEENLLSLITKVLMLRACRVAMSFLRFIYRRVFSSSSLFIGVSLILVAVNQRC